MGTILTHARSNSSVDIKLSQIDHGISVGTGRATVTACRYGRYYQLECFLSGAVGNPERVPIQISFFFQFVVIVDSGLA